MPYIDRKHLLRSLSYKTSSCNPLTLNLTLTFLLKHIEAEIYPVICVKYFFIGQNIHVVLKKTSGSLAATKCGIMLHFYLGLVSRKHVFGVSDEASFKPVSSATEISHIVEISPFANLHMIRFKKRITKALIRLRGCAGWSAPLLFANPRRQIFSRRGPFTVCRTFADV